MLTLIITHVGLMVMEPGSKDVHLKAPLTRTLDHFQEET